MGDSKIKIIYHLKNTHVHVQSTIY